MNHHVKNYNNISVRKEKLVKKVLLYANPTSEERRVRARICGEEGRYVKLKRETLTIPAYSNGNFHLRMYFDRSCKMKEEVVMEIEDGEDVEELHFHMDL